MKHLTFTSFTFFTLILCLLLLLSPALTVAETGEKISRPGEYSGYSQPVYDGYARVSQYVTVQQGGSDETRLALDLLMPTKQGTVFHQLTGEDGLPVKLPVIWAHVPYHRANLLPDGSTLDWIHFVSPWLAELVAHGYVVAIADIRGSGASFGTRAGIFSQPEANDAHDMIEWLAIQPWCTGNVGMFGLSYLGINQFFAASKMPASLKCIFPRMAMFDSYSFIYSGGVFQQSFIQSWGFLTRNADLSLPPLPPVMPVDEDVNGSLLAQAIAEHYGNGDVFDMFHSAPYRDSVDSVAGQQVHITRSPNTYLDDIDASGIPVYILMGWDDVFVRDAFQWYANLTAPRKLSIGPWHHQEFDYDFFAAEHLRWYDYWLKGVENGIMAEAPVYYSTYNAGPEKEWRFARRWPPLGTINIRYFFHEGASGTVASVNDGTLKLYPSIHGKDDYTVDYTTSTGYPTRWTNAWEGPGAPYGYPDMTFNDEKGLTYTSEPLKTDLRVTGHPVVTLWISSTAADSDFFVYLEEVDDTGYSQYITEGVLRASHRKTSIPPFDNLGLPWRRSYEADLLPLEPNDKVKLNFDLIPVSWIFKKGKRIRVTITCADDGNTYTPPLTPAPTVTVYRNIIRASRIKLPVILF